MPKRLNEMTQHEYEEYLTREIERLQYVVNGLKDYGPYLRMVESFKETIQSIDDTWHLVTDAKQYQELRVTKMAAVELVNFIAAAEANLRKYVEDLAKLQNPDELVDKDYDAA